MLPRRGTLFRYIFVHIVFVEAAEKFHFSKWINIDESAASYQFETLISIGIQDCIETCKSKKRCKYINYNTRAHTCAFVGVTPGNEDHLITEDKRGYVFGNKSEWNMDKYEVCERGNSNEHINSRCQNSGCGPPVQIPLTVVYGNMFSVGAAIKYECTEGYKPILINDSSHPVAEQHFSPKTYISAVCQENGNWSFSKFRCLPECTKQLYHVGLHNIARGKNVELSTTFDHKSPGALMVDGNLYNRWPCASTREEHDPSALIDLGQSYNVTSIYIVNRVDSDAERLQKLEIAIGDNGFDLTRASYREEPIVCDFRFEFNGGIIGRFIKLQIRAVGTLTICEVEVYTA